MVRTTKKKPNWTNMNITMTPTTVSVGLIPERMGRTTAKTSANVIERIIDIYRSFITSMFDSAPSVDSAVLLHHDILFVDEKVLHLLTGTQNVPQPFEEVRQRLARDLFGPSTTGIVEALVPGVDEVDDVTDLLGEDAVLLFSGQRPEDLHPVDVGHRQHRHVGHY